MVSTDSVVAVMRGYGMTADGDSVIVGVSGGADSMCLLFLMSDLRERLGISLEAMHVHHGIRGGDADKDLDFVQEQCKKLGIPCKCVRADIPAIAAEQGLSEEEAGRIVRYKAFQDAGADRIAVAHHMEDSAETTLFNLFRGTGLQGLSGIRPVTGNIIRPLIFCSREEIEDYCREKGINYREDATNKDVEYSRNRIRLNILPEAERINPAAARHIGEASEKISEAWDYISAEADKLFKENADLSALPEKLVLKTEKIRDAAPVLKHLIIKKCIVAAAGREKDISGVHVRDAEELMYGGSGRSLSLPYGISAKKSFDILSFIKDSGEKQGNAEIPFIIEENGEEGGFLLPDGKRVTGILTEKPENIPVLRYTKWLDYDKIKAVAVWRTRRKGDRISIKGGTKKLKELFIEEKIPSEDRDGIYVLADGSDILWVPGIRIGDEYKVTDSTERVLKVTMTDERKA